MHSFYSRRGLVGVIHPATNMIYFFKENSQGEKLFLQQPIGLICILTLGHMQENDLFPRCTLVPWHSLLMVFGVWICFMTFVESLPLPLFLLSKLSNILYKSCVIRIAVALKQRTCFHTEEECTKQQQHCSCSLYMCAAEPLQGPVKGSPHSFALNSCFSGLTGGMVGP